MSELLAAHLIRAIPDFPSPGILYRDITPALGSAAAFQEIVDCFVEWAEARSPDVVAGIESRGFLFGAPVALALGVGFAPIRKVGKLPWQTVRREYALEYGTNVVELHRDAVQPGQRVLIVDDVLATGGTAAAAAHLVEQLGGKVAGFSFLAELTSLQGRQAILGHDLQCLLRYE